MDSTESFWFFSSFGILADSVGTCTHAYLHPSTHPPEHSFIGVDVLEYTHVCMQQSCYRLCFMSLTGEIFCRLRRNMFIYLYVYIYVYVYVCVYIYTRIYICISLSLSIFLYSSLCMHTHPSILREREKQTKQQNES